LSTTAEDVRLRHSKVCQSVLATFNAFVEWVPMSHIMANDHYLVRCLCHLLSDEKMQLNAADCLLSIVGWKVGKLPDRAQLLVLFKTDMMAPLFQAVESAERKSHDERHYVFLKRMVQVYNQHFVDSTSKFLNHICFKKLHLFLKFLYRLYNNT
jgi:hypothetical protein